MPDTEEMYMEALKRIMMENQDQINFFDSAINITNAAFIGSVGASVVTAITANEKSLVVTTVLGAISLIANIISIQRKKAIIKKIAIKAAVEVQKEQTLELLKKIFPFIMKNEPISIPILNLSSKMGGLAEALEPEDDVLSLEEEANLLLSYALEVAYPDYEQDVAFIEDVINGYKDGMLSIQGFQENITSMENAMLDKAYRFYTKDIAR